MSRVATALCENPLDHNRKPIYLVSSMSSGSDGLSTPSNCQVHLASPRWGEVTLPSPRWEAGGQVEGRVRDLSRKSP